MQQAPVLKSRMMSQEVMVPKRENMISRSSSVVTCGAAAEDSLQRLAAAASDAGRPMCTVQSAAGASRLPHGACTLRCGCAPRP